MNGKLVGLLVLSALLVAAAQSKKVLEHSAAGPFFTIPVEVGSQRTKLFLGIDGFYGAAIIFSNKAGSGGGGFDRTKSSTWKVAEADRKFDFSLGTAQGPSGNDYLRVGELPPLTMAMFGNPDSASSNALAKLPQASGVIAMWAPQAKDADKTEMQFIVESAKKPIITFHAPASLDGRHTVTIGKEDSSNCRHNWISLKNVASLDKEQRPWTVRMHGFSWGSYKKNSKQTVAFNVGADYFVAPKAHAHHIYNKLGAKYSSRYHGGLVNCNKRSTAPDLVFTAGGKKLKISAKSYIKMFNSNTCLLNIYPDDINWWTLPYQFHQKRCVKYDYGAKTVNIADQA
ncbi:Peptidase A1 domain-containing protein [Aphelenchoides fujianensis]|nr:Peptidase A1 domain-containing protein [Aphelenchoides fujianensis]